MMEAERSQSWMAGDGRGAAREAMGVTVETQQRRMKERY